MIKNVIVTFSDGKIYSIPSTVIAWDFATYWKKIDQEAGIKGTGAEIFSKYYDLILGDEEEMQMWATGITWDRIAPHATYLGNVVTLYDREWREAELIFEHESVWSDED